MISSLRDSSKSSMRIDSTSRSSLMYLADKAQMETALKRYLITWIEELSSNIPSNSLTNEYLLNTVNELVHFVY